MLNNQLVEDLPPRTHNEPPLAEVIAEALRPFNGRRTDLLQAAQASVIVDDESAGKVVNLSQMVGALEREVDESRKVMKAPHLAAVRAIDAEFGAAIQPLTACRSGLRDMLTAFERKRAAKADAARQVALAEQFRREAEAEAARRKAEETAGLGAALDALAARDAAAAAARRANAIRPEPVRAQLGSVGSRREIAFEIEEPLKLVLWMLQQPFRGNLEQALRTIMGSYLRQVGVAAIERGVAIPGLRAWVDTQAQVRR